MHMDLHVDVQVFWEFWILLAGNIYRRFAFIFKIKQSKRNEVSWMLADQGPAMDLHFENH
jgi:hypothetical protein